MRPTDAAKRHALQVLQRWLMDDEPPAVIAVRDDFEHFLGALSACGVAVSNEDPRARLYFQLSVALNDGRAEADVLAALWTAADALGAALDSVSAAADRMRHLAKLVSLESGEPQ